MMKTKITAEEKHYQKLNKRLQQDLNREIERSDNQYKKNYKMAKQIIDLENRVASLEKENEALKELLNLTEDDVKKLIKASSGIDMIVGMGKITYGW